MKRNKMNGIIWIVLLIIMPLVLGHTGVLVYKVFSKASIDTARAAK